MSLLGVTAGGAPARVLALFGPTGVGKTAVAVAVAERLRAAGGTPVAVSVDALQLYDGLAVLTGAASPAERARLEHRLLGVLPVGAACSAGAFARMAHAEIDGLLAAGAVPIVVGGTGLYLRAALAALDLRPPPPPALRARLEAELREHGPEALHARLAAVAPAAAARIAPRDRSRIVRALELSELGELLEREGPNRLWTAETRHPTRLVGLTMQPEAHAAQIERRVQAMIAGGAAEEVRAAAAAGAGPTARKAVGFEELLRGDVEAMVTATRRYARRQRTWLRKLPGAEIVDVTGRTAEEVAAALLPG